MDHFAPTLPVELVDEILQIAKPSKPELARICLISKQFLWPARKQLYVEINIAFWLRCTIGNNSERSYEGVLTETTVKLLETLRHSVTCRQLTSSISFTNLLAFQGTGLRSASTCEGVIKEVLALTSNITYIKLEGLLSKSTRCITDNPGIQQSLKSPDVSRPSTEDVVAMSILPNMKMLGLGTIAGSRPFSPDRPLLPALEVLDCRNVVGYSPACFSHSLTVLRFVLCHIPVKSASLPNLLHLYLVPDSYGDGSVKPADLSPLVHLQTLHFDGSRMYCKATQHDKFFNDLTASLPPQSIDLSITGFLPCSSITQRLANKTLFVRKLGLSSDYLSERVRGSTLQALRTICEVQGVQLSFDASNKIDLLRKSVIFSMRLNDLTNLRRVGL